MIIEYSGLLYKKEDNHFFSAIKEYYICFSTPCSLLVMPHEMYCRMKPETV